MKKMFIVVSGTAIFLLQTHYSQLEGSGTFNRHLVCTVVFRHKPSLEFPTVGTGPAKSHNNHRTRLECDVTLSSCSFSVGQIYIYRLDSGEGKLPH